MTRNPVIEIDGKKVQTVGDVHLGRKYVNGVPIHMRGTIERMQREKFVELLNLPDREWHVLVGDLFDSFIVDPSDVDFAANAILGAARKHTNRLYILLGGNHDESKDLTKISSFENLQLVLREANLKNVRIIDDPEVIEEVGFVSWSAKYSAKELAVQLEDKLKPTYEDTGGGNIEQGYSSLHAVFGHWDVVLPDNANHYNMVPTDVLKNFTKKVITGHVHKPDTIVRDGVEVIMTGAIMPLAHGEEVESDELFYTLTRKEYDASPEKFDHKFVRFVLGEDEDLPDGDFLQVKAYVKPTKESVEEDPNAPTASVTFDVSKILGEFLAKNGVATKKAAEVVERFDAKQDRD